MVLEGFLTLFLSMGTWTWKITKVLTRHPVSYDVIAKSNMADAGHYEKPNFLGFRSTCKCNTTFNTDFCVRNSLPTLLWPLVVILTTILTFKLHILACKVWPHCCYTSYVNLHSQIKQPIAHSLKSTLQRLNSIDILHGRTQITAP